MNKLFCFFLKYFVITILTDDIIITKMFYFYYLGGLSSFSLFILIVAYLKYPKIKTKTNLGRIIMEFFELFGKFFNYAQVVIDINNIYG